MRRVIARVDAWQRRHAVGGFSLAVAKKFGEDRASSLAALSAYYAFFSLFPLLLAFVSILGFVLEGDPALREDIIDTALERIPVIGAELRDDVQPLTGSGVALSSASPARCGPASASRSPSSAHSRRSGTCRAWTSRAA